MRADENKKPDKRGDKTPNWRGDNNALKARGSLSVWLDKDMQWFAPPTGKRGRRPTFSDAAIQFCLSIKCLFGLALRQALGFVHSLLRLAGLQWPVPDYSTLSRRQQTLKVQLPYRPATTALELLVDSVGDAPVMPHLLAQIPPDEKLASVSADGAYDTKACHGAIAQRCAQAIIPPRKNAKIWKDKSAGAQVRNQAVEACKRLGSRIWKKWSGYHRRSLVETKMHCFKRLGERVMAKTFERQVTELQVRVALLNRFTQLGHPVTVPVA